MSECQDIEESKEQIAKWLFKNKNRLPEKRFYANWYDEINASPLTEKEYLNLAAEILTLLPSYMNFNEYQEFCMTTAIYPNRHKNVQYTALGLAGEAGEFANKVKKVQRDQGGRITHKSREVMAEELGDALWYIAMASDEINLSLETIAKRNVDKLTSRKDRGVVGGSGDNR